MVSMFPDLAELWKIPEYRKLIWARFISNYGNGLRPIALAFGVLGLQGANASSLSIVMAAAMAPIVILLIPGGVLADRYPRALIVGLSDVVLSGLVIFNGFAFLKGWATVPLLCLIAVLSGSLNALWWPAFGGLMPEVVPKDKLQSANSINAFGSNVSNIAGTVTGGIVVAGVGAGWALIIDGVTFLIAGILVFQLRGVGSSREKTEHSPTVFDDIKEGWSEFRSHSWVVATVAAYSVAVMLSESLFAVVGPYHAKTELGGPKPWSYILAALSAGMICGVLVSMRYKPKRPLVVSLLSQVSTGTLMLSVGLSHSIVLIMAIAFVAGMSMDFFFIMWNTALQTHIPSESISRVTSYDAFGSLFFTPLGLIIAGPITSKLGSAHTLQLFGVLWILIVLSPLLVRGVRDLSGQPPANVVENEDTVLPSDSGKTL